MGERLKRGALYNVDRQMDAPPSTAAPFRTGTKITRETRRTLDVFGAERVRKPNVGTKMTKSILADTIPEQFWRIRYDQNHDPNTPTLPSISDSPNCQNFAYALLKHFGFKYFHFGQVTYGRTPARPQSCQTS